YIALRNNSETGHLTNVKVQVEDGVVNLVGTVTSEDDIGMVQSIVQELEGVLDVNNNLQVEGIY
ncbi:MAG: BON domain-containing protein, partial [Anaerolineae bacterium]|nr:BON domain-containing protein [Anaerolineae bacterium]